MRKVRDPKAEALAWFARLGHAITTDDLRQFSSWRDDPAHDAAYREVEREGLRLRGRFVVTPDPQGYSVIDSWTGEPATFANAQLIGINVADADDVREILNRRTFDSGGRRRQT
ncbi:FecR/PupR family sigma factor regulator [Phenylobacterium sp.]|uniref:FecR/PupR family sigma factor regulator n=1 Tax=Phenylobacterium sp. TaxID=1871053 RepID=UPI0025D48D34|nr:FecR/PupR family sigma factor regulator [Phenylobacterium sp.]